MATKKNPLSALLNSDERKQAEAFTRDHVTRSAVRQAGTYRVDVQQPIPISQTSLGRLSNSLGTMSGILNQFSDYQGKKEQAELRGAAIEHQMTMQGFQSKQATLDLQGAQLNTSGLHESVKQQNIKLAQAQTAATDAEWDNELSRMNHEQTAAYRADVVDDLKKAESAKAAAELAVARGEPSGELYKSLYNQRTRLIMGSTHGPEYMIFYAQKKAELFGELSENPDALTLSPEAALKMNEDIMSQFMEEKGLSPDNAMGDGFIASVREFNKVRMPESAAQLMEASEQLNKQQTQVAILNSAANQVAAGDDYRIEEQPWFIQLSSHPSADRVAMLMGGAEDRTGNAAAGKNLSVFEMSKRTHKSAREFQETFNLLADTLVIDGKLMREHGNFLNWQADVDEAVEETVYPCWNLRLWTY
jgi:hypothetical protein